MPDIGLSRPYVAKYAYVDGAPQYTGGLRYGRAASMNIELDSPDSNDKYYDNAIGESAGALFVGVCRCSPIQACHAGLFHARDVE